MNISLSERLKAETHLLHAAAERSELMRELIGGRIDRAGYCALLRNLHAIYSALEPALERHARHPVIAPLWKAGLKRTPSLEHDLRAQHGPGWAQAFSIEPAAATYVQRLHRLDASEPALLMAHAYVRYLGDLSGGQILRAVVAKNPALAGAGATAFYDFGDATATREASREFRAGLAAVPSDDALTCALVDEAKLAFELHRQLFGELVGS